jgi:Tfp pilus assembly protein FimV
LVALGMVVGLAGVLCGPVAHAVGVAGSTEAKYRRTYVVRHGDTLWSIALRSSPSVDPRLVVDAIASANEVDPGALVPGQQLLLPAIG